MSVINWFPVKRLCLVKQSGLSMIEVLVSVLVMSVGLTGLAGLQLSSINNATVSYVNTQAIFALQDMVGLLLSSAPAAKAGEFNITPNPDASLKALSDLTVPTGSTPQAEKDRYYWLQNFSDVLPNTKASLMCDSEGVCVIKVQFTDVNKNTLSNSAVREQTVMVRV